MKQNNKKVAIVIIAIIFLYLILHGLLKIPCIFHEITGLYCPGCGITRMFISLIHLDFYQAFRYNPLCFVLLPFLIYIVINTLLKKPVNNKIVYTIIVLLIVFGILRNISTFQFLAPTKL